jgi:hypothetical protein
MQHSVKPGLMRPVEFVPVTPLSNGRVDLTTVTSGHIGTGFAIASQDPGEELHGIR